MKEVALAPTDTSSKIGANTPRPLAPQIFTDLSSTGIFRRKRSVVDDCGDAICLRSRAGSGAASGLSQRADGFHGQGLGRTLEKVPPARKMANNAADAKSISTATLPVRLRTWEIHAFVKNRQDAVASLRKVVRCSMSASGTRNVGIKLSG